MESFSRLFGGFSRLLATTLRSPKNSTEKYFSMGSACLKENDSSYFDTIIGKSEEITEGSIKEIQVNADPPISVILTKREGIISAIGNKCTHYGAPLIKGSYSATNGVIRCPWHGACFNVSSGDIEDFPGLDNLPKYDVEQESNGDIRIRGHFDVAKISKRSPKCSKGEKDETVIIVGGGPAAQVCAETLRSRKSSPWNGKIVIIERGKNLPYDRTKLSKAMTSSQENLQLRPEKFYQEADIEILKGVEVSNVNIDDKKVELKGHGSEFIDYDYLVLASGSCPRKLNVPGHDLNNIFTLRTTIDANKIADNVKSKKVVVVGSSFIGTEVSAFLSDKALSTTLISRTEYPLQAFGPRIGKYVSKLHESKGVNIIKNASVVKFGQNATQNGDVGFVYLDDRKEPLEADVVVLGIGCYPETNYINDVHKDDQGNVIVNSHLESNIPDVYCIGDISKYPLNLPTLKSDTSAAIGHWQLAQSHGRIVGLNVAKKQSEKVEIKTVPFFWTVQYGKSIRYAGYAPLYDEIVYDGTPEEGVFVAYFCHEEVVKAIATLGRDPLAADFANHLMEGKLLSKTDALQGTWRERL